MKIAIISIIFFIFALHLYKKVAYLHDNYNERFSIVEGELMTEEQHIDDLGSAVEGLKKFDELVNRELGQEDYILDVIAQELKERK